MPTDCIHLSPREIQIVQRAATGEKDYNIASELGISIHTVNQHWRHIFIKTGANRREAVMAKLSLQPEDKRQLFFALV